MTDLIARCVDKEGCRAMEAEIKRRGLWQQYRKALTGHDDDIGVPVEKMELWGWSWEQRRAAARQVLL